MAVDRLFDSLVLGALGCLAILGIGRALMLSARGVRIIAIDRERTLSQGLADLGFALCFLLWVYEALAFTLPLSFHLVPAVARAVVLDVGAAKAVGVLVMVAGLVVYGLALRAFGTCGGSGSTAIGRAHW